jgi:hypothetical protein
VEAVAISRGGQRQQQLMKMPPRHLSKPPVKF